MFAEIYVYLLRYTYICCGIPSLGLPQCASLLAAQQVIPELNKLFPEHQIYVNLLKYRYI